MTGAETLRDRSATLRRYLSADPGNTEIACELTDVLAELGEAKSMVGPLEGLLATHPEHDGLRFRLATSCIESGDFARAAELLQELVASGVDGLAVRHNLALAHLCQMDAESAIQALRDHANDHAPSLILLSRANHRLQNYTVAIELARESLQDESVRAEATGLLALLLFDNGNFDEAHRQVEVAARIAPDRLETLLAIAGLALQQDQVEEAWEACEKATVSYPQSGRAWSLKAQAGLARGAINTARESLLTAIKYMPDHVGTWHMLAWCELLEDNHEAAERSFDRALELDRNFDETHGGLAVVSVMRGDVEAARTSVRRALGLNPGCYSARYAEALLLERQGKAEESRKVIEEILQGAPATSGVSIAQRARELAASLDGSNRP